MDCSSCNVLILSKILSESMHCTIADQPPRVHWVVKIVSAPSHNFSFPLPEPMTGQLGTNVSSNESLF